MANHSRWQDVKAKRAEPAPQARSAVEESLELAQMMYDLRIAAGLTQRELAERMGTTQSVISRLEEGGINGSRVDTLARVANALGRHLVISFPESLPGRKRDSVRVS